MTGCPQAQAMHSVRAALLHRTLTVETHHMRPAVAGAQGTLQHRKPIAASHHKVPAVAAARAVVPLRRTAGGTAERRRRPAAAACRRVSQTGTALRSLGAALPDVGRVLSSIATAKPYHVCSRSILESYER